LSAWKIAEAMKIIVIVLALVGALYTAGCDKPVCDCPPFPNGDTIKVGIQEKKNVYGCCKDRFEIVLISVKEDSRCPDGFNCLAMYPVWEGTAKVSVKINSVQTIELEINKPQTTNTGGHAYTLLMTDLTPHPKSGLPTDPNTYQAKIVVSRN
jgi:hypothetical protein